MHLTRVLGILAIGFSLAACSDDDDDDGGGTGGTTSGGTGGDETGGTGGDETGGTGGDETGGTGGDETGGTGGDETGGMAGDGTGGGDGTPMDFELDWELNIDNGETLIAVGDSVTWTWTDNVAHSVFHDADDRAFESEILQGEGESFTFTFEEPGSYPYCCGVHGCTMSGTIVVEE